LEFDEAELEEEFPERTTGQKYGVNVQAASNIAFEPASLAITSMTEQISDKKLYYIESVPTATLRYTSKSEDLDLYDQIGLNSKNQTTLGVNGISANDPARTNIPSPSTMMPVNTEAYYNVQSISGADSAKKLKLTLSLKKKEDVLDNGTIKSVEYRSITDLTNYLEGSVTFKCGDATATKSVSAADNGSLVVYLNTADCSKDSSIYDITISFNAKSGSGFYKYANYEVDLTAVLLTGDSDENDTISNSVATDYLIYTNAKINPEFLILQNQTTDP
jgi:hypothetical protein